MKYFGIVLLVAAGCANFNDIEPVFDTAFIKFFDEPGDENHGIDIVALENGGYLCMGININEDSTGATAVTTWIIETDEFGNSIKDPEDIKSFEGVDLQVGPNGNFYVTGNLLDGNDTRIYVQNLTDGSSFIASADYDSYSGGLAISTDGLTLIGKKVYSDPVDGAIYEKPVLLTGSDVLSLVLKEFSNASETEGTYEVAKSMLTDRNNKAHGAVLIRESGLEKIIPQIISGDSDLSDNEIEVTNSKISDVAFSAYGSGFGLIILTSSVNGSSLGISNGDEYFDLGVSAIEGRSIIQVDNGYMVLATQKPDHHEDFMLLRVDKDFNVLPGWPKHYGGEGDEKDGSLVQTHDGGFAIFGTSVNSKDVFSMVLIKMNKDGELIN